MKISPLDLDFLQTIEPAQIAAYLVANGWKETYREAQRYSLWDKGVGEDELEQIILPFDTQFGDYAERVQDLLRIVSEDTLDDEKTILSRIHNSSFEIIKFLVEQDDFRNGTLPISSGATLFQNARKILLASACSTVDRRPTHRQKEPPEALALLEDVRLGQSILGSYGISLLIPVKQEQEYDAPSLAQRVTITLMKSLSSLMDLVDNDKHPHQDDVSNLVEAGINAELLDSLSIILTRTNADNLTIQVDQSLNSVVPFNAPHSIKIPFRIAGELKELGTILRGDRIQSDLVIHGFVTRLTRGRGEKLGKVVIQTELGNTMREIHVEFDDAQSYERAINAHQEKRAITVKGDLLVKKNRYRLVDATLG